jgi:hypothetical protein
MVSPDLPKSRLYGAPRMRFFGSSVNNKMLDMRTYYCILENDSVNSRRTADATCLAGL